MANMQAVDYRALDGSEPVDEFIEGLSDARKQAALDAEKDAAEADTIDDLRALLPARAGDEFHASGSSKEVLNRKDEHPEEEQ